MNLSTKSQHLSLCIIFSVSLFFSLLFSPTNAHAESATAAALNIGIILPLSGSTSSVGNDIKNGIELAQSDLPPTERALVKLHFEDDKSSTSSAVSAFHALTSSLEIGAVVVMGSANGNAIAPLAERKQIPMIAIAASDVKVVAGRSFVFSHWVSPETESDLLASEIVARNYQHIAIAVTEHDGLQALHRSFRSAINKLSEQKRIALEESFDTQTLDFKSFIAKARGKSADAFMLLVFPHQAAALAKQIREAGINAPLFSSEILEDRSAVAAAQGALAGAWYVSAADPSPLFRETFKKRYAYEPASWAGNAYDTLNLLVRARSLNTEAAKMADFLRSLKDFPGVFGTYSASGDNRFSLPAAIKLIPKDTQIISKDAQAQN